jgi:hypothetical protein
MRIEDTARKGQKFDRFFAGFPLLTDENKRLVREIAVKLTEVQGAASTPERQRRDSARAAAPR